MIKKKKVLFIIGSPKHTDSTSGSLGDYLSDKLISGGLIVDKMFAHKSIKSEETKFSLIKMVNGSDIVVFIFPLYVDSLPYPVIKVMELIKEKIKKNGTLEKKRMISIVNCGFPESSQNETALRICRKFADETGFIWNGGLSMGGGGVIGGRSLKGVGRVARNVVRSLDLVSDALITGENIPEEAVKLMAKPIVPKWIYNFIADNGWKRAAKKYGTQKNLKDRPYKRQ